ncbi:MULTISPECIES: SIMPL domain-containing protein [unclassified Sphingomonas]|uniref:SIMPL domain-containing protein n=1 Tax=unclassified Sphingomonas TaxID=196159 RepID=UPI000B1B32D2|nr:MULTISPECIES: SIMPL domain-containing protein [unclassified Sphingomonas]
MRTLILGTAALIAVPALAQTEAERAPNIQVQGSATVETRPDRARMAYSVRGEGKTADDASRALATTQRAIRDGLGGLLGRDTEMTTGDVAIGEVRGPQCDTNPYGRPRLSEGDCAVVGYIATISGMVRTGAIDRIGTAIGLAGRLGARDARLQNFELADVAAAKRRATAAAIVDARNRAETLATGAGVRLGDLLALTDQTGINDVVVQSLGVSRSAGPPAPPAPPPPIPIDVKPKPIETRATVYARFAIAR